MSASRVTNVTLTTSEEGAYVIRQLLFRLNWQDFQFAEGLAASIDDLELNTVDIDYNQETEEFDRS